MGTKLSTVMGDIDSSELGITSIHEHIALDRAGSLHWEDAFRFSVDELKKARALGLRSIVEVSTRRDVRGIQRVSEESGVNVLVCTGFYTDYNEQEKQYTVDQFRRHMLVEIEQGIDGTPIRPAVIKVAARNHLLQDYERKAFLAAGLVQKETGLPVCTHAVSGCRIQQELLEEAGADLTKVYFSHVEAEQGWEGRSLDQQIEYLIEVVSKGSVLCYNNFGNWAHTKQQSLLAIIHALCSRGYADRQAATMDLIWTYPEGKRKILWEDINEDGPDRTYGYLLSHVVPWLRDGGISEDAVSRMIEKTPLRLFERDLGQPC